MIGRRSYPVALCAMVGLPILLTTAADAGQVTAEQRVRLLSRVPAARILCDTDGNKLFDNLEATLSAVPASERQRVVVRFKKSGQAVPMSLSTRTARHLARDGSVVADLTGNEIRQLAANGAVESIEPVFLCRPTRDPSQTAFGIKRARTDFGLTGDGDGNPNTFSPNDLTIAVLDSGIDPNHPDFAGNKVIAWKDFVNGRPDPYDDNGHGTHVASIAAGEVVNGVGGVAPGASLVGIKVLEAHPDGTASGTSDVIAQAVDWCIDNKVRYGIDVLNLSLGSATSSTGQDVLSRAVDRAAAAGLVVCVSAGNSGPSAYTIGSPAAAADAVSVGSLDYRVDEFALADYSSRGPTADGRIKPDICAPGQAILAAQANTGGYISYSGTSMASPFVAGVCALMLQANPGLSPAEVKALLKKTALYFGAGTEDDDFGSGRIDGHGAIAAAIETRSGLGIERERFAATGSLAGTGREDRWTLNVSGNLFARGIMLTMTDASTNFDLKILDAQGHSVAESHGYEQKEGTVFLPETPGSYTVVVTSYWGAGGYFLESCGGTISDVLPSTTPITVFRPSSREWFLLEPDGAAGVVQFGGPDDEPVPADYLAAGGAQIAVFRRTTQEWFIRNPDGQAIRVQFGGPGDRPVPADYLGLGRAQIAVYRPATREWFIRLDDGSAAYAQFGGRGDVPLPADYFGLGRAQIAVFRPSTAEWFLRTDGGDTVPVQWGELGDQPVPGDYLQLGRAQITVFRPNTGEWFVRQDDGKAARVQHGGAGDIPVPGNYFDGRCEMAVFRPSTAEWFIRSQGDTTRIQWGGPEDRPLSVRLSLPFAP
jgi:serine protease AprX